MTELNNGTLSELPSNVAAPPYDRTRLRPGIAHFGVGNFHRAHQASYIDRCLALPDQNDWGIVGIGLSGGDRSRKKADQFRSQDCLYSLTVAPAKGDTSVRVIGAQLDYLLAPEQPAEVLTLLTDPALRIATLTITEGGYHVDPGSGAFATDHPDIAHDLTGNGDLRTVFGFVTEALTRRRSAGIKPFTVVSCDNLRHNGEVARAAFVGFANAMDQDLGAWIDANVMFPNSLVDRITPSVSAEDAARLTQASGLADHIPVVAEEFSQWVIEDRFTDGRPALEEVGVQFSDQVKLWEQVKVRVLNAGHLTLTYPGLLLGYREVAEAMRDPQVPVLLGRFLDKIVLPLLEPPRDVDLVDYENTVLERFSNEAMHDQLTRIASDSASKVPVFLTTTIQQVLARGTDHRIPAFVLAAWSRVLRETDDDGKDFEVTEPRLDDSARQLLISGDPREALGIEPLRASGASEHADFVATFEHYRKALAERGAKATLSAVLEATSG
ncbi:mannitol dehydrogenase family protein [Mycolicibacterium baixiangningiae]|uniref:mannitol dehydrogenase family protein n=1 Tax=Mycolicibacterium baixiangningiae TaxID=2761578 RepID=UPI0018D127BA|nr:mannitol dehydrogenase family protein [Mycolicibacterium baixiangningiae]